MALSDYSDKYHDGIDVGALDIWTIGKWNVQEIYPTAQEYIPCIYRGILDEDYGGYLPQNHLRFWFQNLERFWTCRYCSFWCDIFDQRFMESHLTSYCVKVKIHTYLSIKMSSDSSG